MAATPITAAGNLELRLTAASAEKPSVSATPSRNLPWGFTFRHPLRSLWPGSKTRYEPAIAVDDAVMAEEIKEVEDERTNESKALPVKFLSKEEEKKLKVKLEENEEEEEEEEEEGENCVEENEEYCDVCAIDDDDEGKIEFNRESFSKLLQKVPLSEARLYAQLSYLGSLAYSIPQIKPGNLLRYHGLNFVTSSLEKKLEQSLKVEKEKLSAENQQEEANSDNAECNKAEGVEANHQDMASFIATTDSVTAVVAAKEEVKQAVADDLNSTLSSPCEWFVCDDDQTDTRFFIIQGSESLDSWKANLLFEPIEFEGLDVLVHRGIYEAAKGMYEQMLPEIRAHLKSCLNRAKFRFTGHSLGGSLSVLVNLMLLIRGEAPPSSLLPVITFGAPSIMCGGDLLLNKLGLPRNHVRSITMHRDIVPRAFSCNYPNHVAEFLKAVNGHFRSHPCLNKQKVLYAPMGELLILQPEDKFSPNHDLLPPGSGLYVLTCPVSDVSKAEKLVRAAQAVFLNSPHPLEILSDPSAYGSEGTIQRDHDMNSYLKSVRDIIRRELNRMRKARRDDRRRVWWPLVTVSRRSTSGQLTGQGQFNFSGIIGNGKESLKRFSTLVAAQHMNLLLVLLLPARLLVLGNFRFS